MSIKLAYICEPQLGGTFTFFQRLRPALAARGIDMRCVTPLSRDVIACSAFANVEGIECVGCDSHDLVMATRQLTEYLKTDHYTLIMVLPAADVVSSNLPAYLPRSIRCVIRVPMMTRGAYAPTQAIAPHVNRIYAVSDRIADDLVGRYGVARDLIEVVYHGIDSSEFDGFPSEKRCTDPVRLLYAGRLWDVDKGVFLLPEIMRHLKSAGYPVRLLVAGSGPDESELRRRFEKADVMEMVEMTGGLPLDRMYEQYRAADIFVFPSRFEGFGFAVLEAMAAGCAPVVSDIRGSLRVIVDNGQAGLPARVGDAADFARAIGELVRDRHKLQAIQQQAWQRAREVYSLDRMADRYAASFRMALDEPDRRAPAHDLADYTIPKAFRPTWRTLIPRPVKNFIRTWLERFGLSS